MKLVVTGSSGGLGRALIPHLCSRPDVTQVVGIDLAATAFKHPKYSTHQADICSQSLAPLFADSTALVHLAFAVTQGKMTSEQMRFNNVMGSLNVFRMAQQSKIRKIINLSSASVYGAGEQLDESAPLKPSSRFPYACHKAELEIALLTQFPNIDVINLRPMFILGPNAVPFLRKMCTWRLYVVPHSPHPLIQVVHEEDVATGVMAALNPNVRTGAYNLAAPESLTVPQLVRNGRTLTCGLPIGFIERVVGERSNDGQPRPIDAALELLRASLTVSCRRARDELGWKPKYGAWEARASCG